MPDHGYYEELAALAAGGRLTQRESDELRAHLSVCSECRQDVAAYRDLVCSGLPLANRAVAASPEPSTAKLDAGARARFLARARREGVRFSPDAETHAVSSRWSPGSRVAAALAVAAVLVAAFFVPQISRFAGSGHVAQQEVDRLRDENTRLGERLAVRDQDFAGQQDQLRKLRADLDAALKSASDLRQENRQQGLQLGKSTSETAQLAAELQNREQQLASAAEELARVNELRITDRATLDAQRVRIREISHQLRIADATIEVERQLSAAGADIRELMAARQLRVVDVRDTDAAGQPSAAFGRVFMAQGRSIRIFAFDLNDGENGTARRFQLWGEHLGDAKSVRSLGVLDVDDRTQNRWTLTVQSADVVKDIDSVFVTTAGERAAPEGPRFLYTFLGQNGPQ
jgi:hypothetical protein